MKKNMGGADRTIRILIAAIIVALYYFKVIDGILGIVLLVFAGIFVLISVFSFCPFYPLLGINTCSVKKS